MGARRRDTRVHTTYIYNTAFAHTAFAHKAQGHAHAHKQNMTDGTHTHLAPLLLSLPHSAFSTHSLTPLSRSPTTHPFTSPASFSLLSGSLDDVMGHTKRRAGLSSSFLFLFLFLFLTRTETDRGEGKWEQEGEGEGGPTGAEEAGGEDGSCINPLCR